MFFFVFAAAAAGGSRFAGKWSKQKIIKILKKNADDDFIESPRGNNR